MSSIGNYSLTYPAIKPAPRPPQTNANDVHIAVANGNLELIGVEGVGTENPTATFNVEGQGTAKLTISGIDIPPDGKLNVRLKSNGNMLPKVNVTWTFNGNLVKNVPQAQQDHAAAPPPASGDQGENAAVLFGLLEELVRLYKERTSCPESPSSEVL